MHIYQLQAWLPETGLVDVLASPPLEAAPEFLHGGAGDEYGNQSFWIGGAILAPFCQRLRGTLDADGMLAVEMRGKTIRMPANWKGKKPDSERCAIHGLMLATAMDEVRTKSEAKGASVEGTLKNTDFRGHWPSRTNLTVTAALWDDCFDLEIMAQNAGGEDLPVGLGWHPYFALPSGDRTQVKIQVPATRRLLLDDYDDAFPNGLLASVAGSAYDFSMPGGKALSEQYLEDCFVGLERNSRGHSVTKIVDPAARYGLRMIARSAAISAYQVYAPLEKAYVAFEPVFNWPDPFSKVWDGRDTGMVVLKPGKAVRYSVRLQVFDPISGTRDGSTARFCRRASRK